MKVETINGEQYVILEENDKVHITTEDELSNSKIDIQENNKKLDISGDSSIISSITGEGMSDKVIISSNQEDPEEIISKCDNWLNMFKKVHNSFKKLVLTEEYRKNNITMSVKCGDYILTGKGGGYFIKINLVMLNRVINEGIEIYVDDSNKDVYSYLLASVLEYYVSHNLQDVEIDLMAYNGCLYSNIDKGNSTVPMIAEIDFLSEDKELNNIVKSIIIHNNLREPAKHLVVGSKIKIRKQQMNPIFDEEFNKSSKMFNQALRRDNYTNKKSSK